MDRETGRSKGFGFVEMPNDEEGNAAIAALNEKEIDGKTLAVSVARPREEGPRRNSNYGGGINRTRLPVCQNRLIEEMPGICSGHLFL